MSPVGKNTSMSVGLRVAEDTCGHNEHFRKIGAPTFNRLHGSYPTNRKTRTVALASFVFKSNNIYFIITIRKINNVTTNKTPVKTKCFVVLLVNNWYIFGLILEYYIVIYL